MKVEFDNRIKLNRKDATFMTDEEMAMIEWLQNATNEEILREMHAVEREIFRRDE